MSFSECYLKGGWALAPAWALNRSITVYIYIYIYIIFRESCWHCLLRELNTSNNALQSSGFTERLNYTLLEQKRNRRNRPRKTLWFNPPYSMNVQTNIGRHFLQLVDKHFPNVHVLNKIFNRGNYKVSYSCMDNLATIIKKHNAKILKPNENTINKECNCRKKSECLLNVECMTPSIVYKATVTLTNREPKAYIGMTESNFKSRFRNHKQSFNNKQYSSSTALSKYIWELKESNDEYSINWSINWLMRIELEQSTATCAQQKKVVF